MSEQPKCPVWKITADIAASISEEDAKSLPKDFSRNLDDYLYSRDIGVLPIDPKTRELLDKAIAAVDARRGKPMDIEAWAKRLAEDVCNAGD